MTARLPIRWRLTVWYAALLAAALVLFGLGLYLGLRAMLEDSFEEQARHQAAVTLAAVQTDGGEPTIDQATISSLQDDEHFVQLLAADGRVLVDSSASVGGVPIESAGVDAALIGETRLSRQDTPDDTFLVVTAPVRSGETIVGVIRVGSSREDVDETTGALLIALAVAAPVVLVAASAGGYLLAGRALAPVATITNLAGSIKGDDLRARLNLDLPDDELGRLARTFDGMLARIEDAFERQRRFTGDAAHELRTPLSLMRSQVDLALARPRSPDEYREALYGLEGDIERLTALLGTLLTLARADAHSLPLERAPMDLAETIAVTLEQYAHRAEEAGIALRDESSPAELAGDEDLLIQVLVNLLDNALAHTPAGGTIAVGCRAEDERVRLWVADTGVGIPPEHQARIFDRFYRPDFGRTRAYGGAGLGLAICKAIVEAHNGRIGLTSAAGSGTRVEILVPRT